MPGNEPAGTASRRIHSAIFTNLMFVCATLIGVVPGQLGGASLVSSSADVAVRHGLLAAAPQTISTAAPIDVLNIRVYPDRDTGKNLTRDATTVAERLLATAGVATRWLLCANAAECPGEGEITEPVVVILSSSPRRGSPATCGYATRRDARAIGTVVISIPCIAESTARIVGSADTPLPMIRRHDDVVGAVIAHEVAHLLGLPHTEAGLMSPHLGPAEIVDLRLDRLHFTEPEAALMRTAVSRAVQAAGLAPWATRSTRSGKTGAWSTRTTRPACPAAR